MHLWLVGNTSISLEKYLFSYVLLLLRSTTDILAIAHALNLHALLCCVCSNYCMYLSAVFMCNGWPNILF